MQRNKHRVAGALLALVILVSAGLAMSSTASADGTGPDDALVLTGEWAPLNPEESLWYAFWYAGDGSQITVRLEMEPDDGAAFAVWTPDQIWHWGLGEYVEPVGRGSPDPRAEGTLLWSGNFLTSGTYYVVVEHSGRHPGTVFYLLEVEGTGVSTFAPTPTPTATPAPVTSQAKAKAPAELVGKLVFQTTYGGEFYSINVDGRVEADYGRLGPRLVAGRGADSLYPAAGSSWRVGGRRGR